MQWPHPARPDKILRRIYSNIKAEIRNTPETPEMYLFESRAEKEEKFKLKRQRFCGNIVMDDLKDEIKREERRK